MGLSSSQPVPSPSIYRATTPPPRGSGPKMDDWAASQQLMQEEAQSARTRRFRSPLSSYALPDLQAFTEGDSTASAWPTSPLKRFALRSANRDVLVPDSQAEPPSTDAPPMSQTTSTQAVPASSAPKRNTRKGKTQARAEAKTAIAPPEVDVAEVEPPRTTRAQRKRKLAESEVSNSSASATPAKLAAASPKNDPEAPSSAKRRKKVLTKAQRIHKRKSMEAMQDNGAVAEDAQAVNGDAEQAQSPAVKEQEAPKPKKKKPRHPGKQAALEKASALETAPATADELPEVNGDGAADTIDEPVDALAMEEEPILPESPAEDPKAEETSSQSKKVEETSAGTPTPENDNEQTPASETKATAALQSSSKKEKSKKRRKGRKSEEVAPEAPEQDVEQDPVEEIADTQEPVSEEQEDTVSPVEESPEPQQAESQDPETAATPNKTSDSDEREGQKSSKRRKSEKLLDTCDWTAPPVRNVDEPPEETPSYEGLEEVEEKEDDEQQPASTTRDAKKKDKGKRKSKDKVKEKDRKKDKKKDGATKTPRKDRKSLPPSEQYRRAVEDDGLTSAERALEKERELHHPPDLRKNGDFTEDEQELVRRAIRDYQERKGITTHELVSIIQYTHDYKDTANTWAQFGGTQSDEQEKQESLEFWNEMKETSLKRDFATIKGHIRARYHTFRTGRWSDEEIEQLRSLHALHPGQWKLISHVMGTRSLNDVFNRWRDYEQFGETRNINRWNEEEENNLVRVLSLVCQRDEDQRAEMGRPPLAEYTNSDINWAQVCIELGNTRSRIQCQQKWSRMKTRKPPATIDIEVKERDPNVVYTEPQKDRKSGSKQGSGDSEGKKKRQSRKKREPPTLSADQMLWGDKFDLVAVITERAVRDGLEDASQIDWEDVSAGMEQKWPVAALQTAFTQLTETIDEQDNLVASVSAILAYMNEHWEAEMDQRYEAPREVESEDDGQTRSKKRKRGEGKASSSKRKKTDARQPVPKPKSKALITESDDESEHEA